MQSYIHKRVHTIKITPFISSNGDGFYSIKINDEPEIGVLHRDELLKKLSSFLSQDMIDRKREKQRKQSMNKLKRSYHE